MAKKSNSQHNTKRKKPASLPPVDSPPANNINDPKLGLLRFAYHINPQLDEFEGSIEVDGQSVKLLLYTDENLDLTPTIKRARDLVRRHRAMMKRADKYLVTKLLPQYNEQRRAEGESEIKKSDLLDQVQLAEITVHADGRATYWYTAGDLFWGHILQLFMNAETEFTDYDTPG